MKRMKVQLEFPEKLFYEKVLLDWKENIPDKNQASVIRKALENIRLFPINLNGYDELRKIKGIGENIATRLDAAWKMACESYFKNSNPSIDKVRSLKKGDTLSFLQGAFVAKGRQTVPFFPKKPTCQGTTSQQNTLSVSPPLVSAATSCSQPTTFRLADSNNQLSRQFCSDVINLDETNNCFNISFSQPAISTFLERDENCTEFASQVYPTFSSENNQQSFKTGTNSNIPKWPSLNFASTSTLQKSQETIKTSCNSVSESSLTSLPTSTISTTTEDGAANIMLSYDPSECNNFKLLLIVDEREKRGERNGRKIGIDQHLQKLEVVFETRSLSVGDYLWVVKNGAEEMVLDYIVERKTWDDLKSSIRKTRYHEQKRRLKESGIRNIIIVAEGQPTSDRSLEQALVSTTVENHFLIHRTLSLQGTAKFLQTLTTRLAQRLKTEHMCGPSFASLQDASRKTKIITVQDCWLRQLTVCPTMSVEKAKLIVEQFPTLRALADFYKRQAEEAQKNGTRLDLSLLLYNTVNDLPKGLSAQLSLFFEKDCCKKL